MKDFGNIAEPALCDVPSIRGRDIPMKFFSCSCVDYKRKNSILMVGASRNFYLIDHWKMCLTDDFH